MPTARSLHGSGVGPTSQAKQAMLDYFDCANLGNHHSVVEQLETRLFEGETIVSILAFESRVAKPFPHPLSLCESRIEKQNQRALERSAKPESGPA
jgi:hypothetical protein